MTENVELEQNAVVCHTKNWKRATFFVQVLSLISNILLIVAIGMTCMSVYMDVSWLLPITWIQSAQDGVFSEHGHFFHVFLYSLAMLVSLSAATHFVAKLMGRTDVEKILPLWEVYLYILVILAANITSFTIFIHTATEVVVKH